MSDVLVSGSKDLTINNNEIEGKPLCTDRGWYPLFSGYMVNPASQRNIRLTFSFVKDKGIRYIHYISNTRYGYYRLIVE
jgi:hypothetical protein